MKEAEILRNIRVHQRACRAEMRCYALAWRAMRRSMEGRGRLVAASLLKSAMECRAECIGVMKDFETYKKFRAS